jgi:DNA-binding beta-propeller fold protein YncE
MSHPAPSKILRPRRLAALLSVCLAALLLSAEAQADPTFTSQLGSGQGAAAGQIEYPWGVAVDPSSGNVYLADGFTNNRVDEYSSGGTFTRAWGWGVVDGQSHFEICTTTCHGGGYSHSGGAFDGIRAITVDTASGNVYVVDQGDDRIDEFSSTGSFIQDFGMGVQDGNANVLETCSASCTYGQGGVLASPTGIAFDPVSGNLYVVSSAENAVSEFTPAGGFVKEYGWGVTDGQSHFETCTTVASCQAGTAGGGAGQLATPEGVAVDPHSGNVYVADAANNRIDEFSSAGSFIRAEGWGVLDGATKSETCTATCQAGLAGGGAGEIPSPYGVTVDSTGDIYVAEYSQFSGSGNRIDEFDSSGNFILTFGWRVSADQQLAYEVCRSACEGGLAGGNNGEFVEAGGVAVDGGHSLYVADLYPEVQRFDVTATVSHSLTVSLTGAGKGSVTATGINCPGTCSHSYPAGTKVTLTPKPAAGSRFTGWGGSCTGTGACTVTLSANEAVTAAFAPKPPACTLASTGAATMSSDGAGTLPVQVTCNQTAAAKLKGTLTDKRTGVTAKQFALPAVSATAHAGVKLIMKLTLPVAAMKDLKAGATESVALTLTATNANGVGHSARKVPLHKAAT